MSGPGSGPGRQSPAGWLTLFTVAVLLVGAVVVVLVRGWLPVPSPVAGTALAGDPTVGPTSGLPPTGLLPPQPPEQLLAQQVAQDAPAVTGILDQWVPQVSSKRVGLVVGPTTYGFAEILADHRTLRARFPGAVLLRSEDFTSYQLPGFFVTVVAQPFPTPEAANAWCDQFGLGPDDCLAKRVSRTADPASSTRTRS